MKFIFISLFSLFLLFGCNYKQLEIGTSSNFVNFNFDNSIPLSISSAFKSNNTYSNLLDAEINDYRMSKYEVFGSPSIRALEGEIKLSVNLLIKNNKEEIRKSRDMAWIRIDRYYSSDMTKEIAKKEDLSIIDTYAEMEEPAENPEVVFQPVMCQHCNHAPCENVCPVAATTHSDEGLNQMTYNRCVGTRYCANNCPYKVRRFNWFQYSDNDQFDFNMNDDLGKMVLNPDVVVRSRGVIEKCSMCIQKIQALKLDAKKSGKPIKDSDAQTVCASSCSTGAIVFGDKNDPKSEVSKLRDDSRAYDLLDHLNLRPSVFYQTKIRNK